jgi:hypothetical protein
MMRLGRKASLLVALFLAGCTSVQVQPLSPTLQVKHVCIQENPKVKIDDFVPVVRDGFDRHGISTEVVLYGRDVPERCTFILTYAAVRAWDFAEYMHYAELRLESKGRRVAYAEYRLVGKGGLSMMKWQSTRTKMDPVIDELLQQNK